MQLAEWLVGGDFDPGRSLELVEYPACQTVQFSGSGELSITIHTPAGKQAHTITRGEPYYVGSLRPIDSWLQFDGSEVVQFMYQSTGIGVKQLGKNQLSIPAPPGWPVPRFLTLRYPPQPMQ